jgi:hypothetical protein
LARRKTWDLLIEWNFSLFSCIMKSPKEDADVVDMLKQVMKSNKIIHVPEIIDPSYADL